MARQDNLIVKYVHGVAIRLHNKVYVDIPHTVYEKLVEQAFPLRLSAAQLVRLMACPCQKCGHDKIEIFLHTMTAKTAKQGFTILKKAEKNENNH